MFASIPAANAEDKSSGAIQAIQQASDPSAAVAAYANGIAADRSNPQIYAAYVAKMVDLGLPELAFHQAESLTTMQSDNGLGWGVVAYVDARRGQMPEAISAIVLAGQFAPDNPFVQRTAGELSAWYDLKADKSTLPDATKDAMSKIRLQLKSSTAFTEAYNTASKAYQSANSSTQSSQSPAGSAAPPAQPQSDYAGPDNQYAPPADYYPDYANPGYGYYYASGPGWVAPPPWWWWWPVGFWGGCSFFPFAPVVVFSHGFFFHFHFHDGFFVHNKNFFHDTHHGGHFFGAPAHAQFHANFAKSTASSAFHFHGAPAPTRTLSQIRTAQSFNRPATQRFNSSTIQRFNGTTAQRFSGSTMQRFNGSATRPAMNRGIAPAGRTFGNMQGAPQMWHSPAFANRSWSASRQWAPQTFRSPAPNAFAAAPRMGGFQGGFAGGGMHGFQGGGGFHGGGAGGFGGGHGGGGGHMGPR
jgi:hypothetical protein